MKFSKKILHESILRPNTLLIFIDGGTIHFENLKKIAPLLVKKSFTIGDGDSSKKPMDIKKMNQNESDLSFALHYLKKHFIGIKTYMLVGFLGGRLDHELFVLGEITSFIKSCRPMDIIEMDIEKKLSFFPGGRHLLFLENIFSVLSFEPNHIKIKGQCKYPTKGNAWLKIGALSSQGLSNIGNGEVEIQAKKPFALFHGRI